MEDVLSEVIDRLKKRTSASLSQTARASRRKIDAIAMQKDLDRLYWKLGKEVVALCEANEIAHPGLENRVERIKEQLSRIAANENPHD